MRDKKVSTTMDTIINIIKHTEKDPDRFNQFIDALTQTIPVKGRKRMPKVDTNLNGLFLIKRINYNVVAKITKVDPQLSMYEAKVTSIDCNKDVKINMKVGDTLFISKRELEVTGRKQAWHLIRILLYLHIK